jgi:Transposase
LARTLVHWREPILAWHTTGHTSGPIEGLNSLIKKVKRIATGLRSFPNHPTPLKREAARYRCSRPPGYETGPGSHGTRCPGFPTRSGGRSPMT